MRLGVVRLETPSLLDDAAVLRLRALGFDVDDLHAVPATSTRNFLDGMICMGWPQEPAESLRHAIAFRMHVP
jgi:hypothetical protein